MSVEGTVSQLLQYFSHHIEITCDS